MARQMVDIHLDASEDLAVNSGDFTTVESTPQHQQQLIMNDKGDFKQNPVACVGVFEYLYDENFGELIRTICLEFTKDGMDVVSVRLMPGGVVSSDAFYK